MVNLLVRLDDKKLYLVERYTFERCHHLRKLVQKKIPEFFEPNRKSNKDPSFIKARVDTVTATGLKKVIEFCSFYRNAPITSEEIIERFTHFKGKNKDNANLSAGRNASVEPPDSDSEENESKKNKDANKKVTEGFNVLPCQKYDPNMSEEEFEMAFMPEDPIEIVEVCNAAIKLVVPQLKDMACKCLADWLEEKEVEEVRETFGLHDDFPTDEDSLRERKIELDFISRDQDEIDY